MAPREIGEQICIRLLIVQRIAARKKGERNVFCNDNITIYFVYTKFYCFLATPRIQESTGMQLVNRSGKQFSKT